MMDCNEKTPRLGIDGIKMHDEHITMQAFFYLSHMRAFEKQSAIVGRRAGQVSAVSGAGRGHPEAGPARA